MQVLADALPARWRTGGAFMMDKSCGAYMEPTKRKAERGGNVLTY
jgi:hypothetical protein